MVNRGPSAGCLTCKQRRVKCDEAKPECRACVRLALRCEGYTRPTRYARLKFKDQNHKFGTEIRHTVDATNGDVSQASNSPSRLPDFGVHRRDVERTPTLRSLSNPDTAVLFYLYNYASLGREMESTRGFFELLIPTYFAQPQDSALSLAVSALASEVWLMWLHHPSSFRTSRGSYTRAIASLRNATQDPMKRDQPATALAALVLQTYENASAIFDLRWASSMHHKGAASLVSILDMHGTDVTLRAYLCKFILHTEVSTAIRQKKPLTDIAYSYLRSETTSSVPDNPSSALDAIGVSIAELQSRYIQFMTQGVSMTSLECVAWNAEIKVVDGQLLAWAKAVPYHWKPSRLVSGRDFHPSIPSFQPICDVYPSCQVASIWNLWRFHRILLMKMILGSLGALPSQSCIDSIRGRAMSQVKDFINYEVTLQETIDSVCHSIPFYLGNRTTRSSLTDFTDPLILLPVDTPLGDATPMERSCLNAGVPGDDHRRHIIAQGPWRAMHPLSSLLTLFSEVDGDTMFSLLRPGQRDWVRDQFSRVAKLLHLPQGSEDCMERSRLHGEGTYTRAEVLASDIRKGAILMSGP